MHRYLIVAEFDDGEIHIAGTTDNHKVAEDYRSHLASIEGVIPHVYINTEYRAPLREQPVPYEAL